MQGTQEFKDTVPYLSQKGKEALLLLRSTTSLESAPFRSRLGQSRNTLAFHYDHKEFRDGLQRYIHIFAERESVESEILLRHNGRATTC
jgi:hypothetical protein